MEFWSYLRVTMVLLTHAVSLETLLTVMDLNILLRLQDFAFLTLAATLPLFS